MAGKSGAGARLWLWLLLQIVTGRHHCCCNAETRDERHVHLEIPFGTATQVYGAIHGSGYLDFAPLTYNLSLHAVSKNVTVEIATAILRDDYQETTLAASSHTGVMLEVGIGSKGTVTGSEQTFVCCSQVAVDAGACGQAELGKLIVGQNPLWPNTTHRTHVTIQAGNTSHGTHGIGMMGVQSFDRTTHVIMVVSNCQPNPDSASNNDGNQVIVHGNVIYLSYVAINSLPYILLIAVGHLALAIWYRTLMIKNQSSRIRLEEWIHGVLWLAAVALCCKTIDYLVEATSERELMLWKVWTDWLTRFVAIVSRVLYVMVAIGWGVTKPTLSTVTRTALWIVGGLNVLAITAFVLDMDAKQGARFVRRSSAFKFGENVEFWTGVVFLVWIPSALVWTMYGLSKGASVLSAGVAAQGSGAQGTTDASANSQDYFLKLQRYRWMLRIYFLAIALKIVSIFLFFFDMVKDGGREFDMQSVTEGDELIYLIILACLAYLWRPNPDATRYCYVLLDEGEDLVLLDQDDVEGGSPPGSPSNNLELELESASKWSSNTNKPYSDATDTTENPDSTANPDGTDSLEAPPADELSSDLRTPP